MPKWTLYQLETVTWPVEEGSLLQMQSGLNYAHYLPWTSSVSVALGASEVIIICWQSTAKRLHDLDKISADEDHLRSRIGILLIDWPSHLLGLWRISALLRPNLVEEPPFFPPCFTLLQAELLASSRSTHLPSRIIEPLMRQHATE